MVELRQNRAKNKLKNNETVIAVSSSDTDMIDFLGSTGLVDMIWVEMEHGPVTWNQLGDISRACDLWGMTSLARVHNNDPWLVGRALDRGVQGVVVPHVDTKTDAERLEEEEGLPQSVKEEWEAHAKDLEYPTTSRKPMMRYF